MMPQITKDYLVKWPGRTPSPKEKKTDCAVDFIVGGRVYKNLKDLKVETSTIAAFTKISMGGMCLT